MRPINRDTTEKRPNFAAARISQGLRLGVIAAVLISLLAGLWAALVRLGWALPTLSTALPGIHGPLMISGVLGTLIALERAVALAGAAQKSWHVAFLAPLCSAIGAILLIFMGGAVLPILFLLAGSLGLAAIFAYILRREFAVYTITMMVGSLFQAAAILLWLSGSPIYQAVHSWVAFLVLTIVGERLELSRVRKLPRLAFGLFAVIVGGYAAAVSTTSFALDTGIRLAGLGHIALALWLFRYDIATKTIRKTGQPRFIAACLLTGYGWLLVGGVIGTVSGTVYAGFQYDALLHSMTLGFVFSMIFGHALVIFPALTGRLIPFRRGFYACLVAFHLSLVVRIAGDIASASSLRMWGGMFDVLTLLIFLAVILQTGLSDQTLSNG